MLDSKSGVNEYENLCMKVQIQQGFSTSGPVHSPALEPDKVPSLSQRNPIQSSG